MAASLSAMLKDINVAIAITRDLENDKLRCATLDYRRAGAYDVPAVHGTASFVQRIAFLTLFPMLGVAAAVERRGANEALRRWGRNGIGKG